MDFVEELTWRGMLKDIMPGTQEQLANESTLGYIGFDPTADSLHVGNLVPIMMLVHFQRAGHRPIALVGGATGMVGDPSGRNSERQLLSEDILDHNLACIRKQLERFLDFEGVDNPAEIVNNYDWFKGMSFLEFIRDVGKHITINYMMAKDSVQNRLEKGLSFTEFSYQLVQGYDFYWLYKEKNCKLQMGGSDQWGNITTGPELVRRKAQGEAFSLTCPLITKADGSKFGKSAGGNVWLDAEKTSPYAFYQYWRQATDVDAKKYIRIFTLLEREEIEALEAEHDQDPGRSLLQKKLAEELTVLVHGQDAFQTALAASQILFGKGTEETLRSISESDFLSIFEKVPTAEVSRDTIAAGLDPIQLFAGETGFLASNGEVRRMIKQNALSVNSNKVQDGATFGADDLINDNFLVLKKGKRDFFVVRAV